jgi:PAS domain S-box-containing protein
MSINDQHKHYFESNEILTSELLGEVLRHTSQLIVFLNAQSEIVFCTENIKELYGYKKEEVISRSVFDFFLPCDKPALKEKLDKLIERNGPTASAVLQLKNKEGRVEWIEISVKKSAHQFPPNYLFVVVKRIRDNGAYEKQLTRAIAAAKEEERRHIAAELHDNVNQIITASKLLVDTALKRVDKEELLQECSYQLEVAAEEIRKLSYSLVNQKLPEFNFRQAVEDFIATMKIASQINFNLSFNSFTDNAMSSEQCLHLYRIIQEAVINIVKHAEASTVQINLTKGNELNYLIIKDDGKGIVMKGTNHGMGLSGITNRVKVLKGHFYMTAPDCGGTTIEIHFPLS